MPSDDVDHRVHVRRGRRRDWHRRLSAITVSSQHQQSTSVVAAENIERVPRDALSWCLSWCLSMPNRSFQVSAVSIEVFESRPDFAYDRLAFLTHRDTSGDVGVQVSASMACKRPGVQIPPAPPTRPFRVSDRPILVRRTQCRFRCVFLESIRIQARPAGYDPRPLAVS